MNLKKIFKHSFVGIASTAVVGFANIYFLNQQFETQKNLSIKEAQTLSLKGIESKFERIVSFEYKTKITPIEKTIARYSFEPQKIKTEVIKIVKTKNIKMPTKAIDKVEIALQDTISLPTHKGIELQAFKTFDIETINLASLWISTEAKIAAINDTKTITEDRISTALAATEKSPSENNNEVIAKTIMDSTPAIPKEDNGPEVQDEFIAFDYSTPKTSTQEEKSEDKKVQEFLKEIESEVIKSEAPQKIIAESINVKVDQKTDTIEPEFFDIKKAQEDVKKQNVVAVTETKKEEAQEAEQLVFDYTQKNDYSFCSEKKGRETYNTTLTVSPKVFSFNGRTARKLADYEVQFKDDHYNRILSHGDEPIIIEAKLNGVVNIRKATISARDIMTTSTDLVFEFEPVVVNLPVISRDAFSELVNNQNLRAQGGHLLVELDDMTETVDLSLGTKYEKRIFLDSKFRVVNQGDSEYSYIMFVGVKTGNTVLTYKTWKNEMISKIIHIAQDEIYYDFNLYIEENQDKFELCEESVLSKKTSEIYVNANQVKPFGFDAKVKNLGINALELNRMVYPLGTRKYYSLGEGDNSLFIGRFEDEQVVIPSLVYRSFVLENFGLRHLGNQCVVQVNLKKSPKDVIFEGQSEQGYMRVNHMMLDRDGIFYDEFTENTQKIFFLGESQGVINLKIEYTDGSSDFLMTYCSDATYLVEQL